jgi:hypothetical protein
MVLALILPAMVAALQTQTPPAKWFGPVTVRFHVVFDGDPFDPDQNDVRVRFKGEHGETYERIAYFDGSGYAAKLVAPTADTYTSVLVRNGMVTQAEPDLPKLSVDHPLPNGFIRRNPLYPNRFQWDSGTPYYPVGIDMAWKTDSISLTDQLAKLAAAGGNWCRIWACSWDGKNPWWPINDPEAIKNQMWLPALDQWSDIVDTCDKNNLPFQFTLFHHGEVSTTTDPNWPDNPWNAAKGGFLKDPADFFTDAEAKRRTKMWLRYAVARYASSPELLGWELFNEVQWVDAMKTREVDVAAWHGEMADYIRSIDPYQHLVTSSSTLDYPNMLTKLDYLQPHTYPADIMASILGTKVPDDKPVFYGEFGPGGKADARKAMRDGMYAGMLANQAGAGQYWYWDIVEKEDLYGEITKAQRAVVLSDLPKHATAHRAVLKASAPGGGDLAIRPGGGFEKAKKLKFMLPDEATPADTGGLPQFIQGENHRDMFPGPIELHFTLAKSGTMKLAVGSSARSGAALVVREGDTQLLRNDFVPADKDVEINKTYSVPLKAGAHVIKISNPGVDWFTLSSITIPGLGSSVRVVGLEDGDWMFARLTAADGAVSPLPVDLTSSSLLDGQYTGTVLDLGSGQESTVSLKVFSSRISTLSLVPKDAILILKRQ